MIILKHYTTIIRTIMILLIFALSSCKEDVENEMCKVSVVDGEGGTAKVSDKEVVCGWEVTLTAFPNDSYCFLNWTKNGVVVSDKNPYTTVVTSNTQFKANFKKVSSKEYEYVDLGLSVKWATCNVGADSPEEYGDYFAWGETMPKITYNWSTYKYSNGSSYVMTKYSTDLYYGVVDNKTTLEYFDDAASVNWGGGWRIPTIDEWEELRDTYNSIWVWTTQNGVNGYKVISKKNGNSIFLPASGYRSRNNLYYDSTLGDYLSSSLSENYSNNACVLDFNSSDIGWNYSLRYYGKSVRAVCE